MRGLFHRASVNTSHILSKSDKRRLSEQAGVGLNKKDEYTISLLSNKAQIIKVEGVAVFFRWFDRLFPTVKTFDRGRYKCVTLDQGAVGPILNGADVMAPGILKYEEQCPEFGEDEVVGVDIVGRGIIAVGLTTVSSDAMKRAREGPVIDVLHVSGDDLDSGAI